MKLKEVYYSKTKNMIIAFLIVCVFIVEGVQAQAASTHTTKPSITINAGNNNPFKHDSATCTITYCTRHPHGRVDLNASKVYITLEVKSSAKNTKTQRVKYESAGIDRSDLTYCDWNKGSKSISQKTAEKDKYKVKARYATQDFFCLTCVNDASDYEKYCNVTSDWKTE